MNHRYDVKKKNKTDSKQKLIHIDWSLSKLINEPFNVKISETQINQNLNWKS